MAAFRGHCFSGEFVLPLSYSRDREHSRCRWDSRECEWSWRLRDSCERERSRCRWEPDCLDPQPWRSSLLIDPAAGLSRSPLQCLSLASSSKSLNSLRNRSSSSSLSSNRLCPEASDAAQSVWYDPSPRPNSSSSCSYSLSLCLFCLRSCHMDPLDDPTEPLLAEPSDRLPDIFQGWVSVKPWLYRRSPQTVPIVRTLNELNRPISFLGSQYTYNVGFGCPTLGDSNLETQQCFYNL